MKCTQTEVCATWSLHDSDARYAYQHFACAVDSTARCEGIHSVCERGSPAGKLYVASRALSSWVAVGAPAFMDQFRSSDAHLICVYDVFGCKLRSRALNWL